MHLQKNCKSLLIIHLYNWIIYRIKLLLGELSNPKYYSLCINKWNKRNNLSFVETLIFMTKSYFWISLFDNNENYFLYTDYKNLAKILLIHYKKKFLRKLAGWIPSWFVSKLVFVINTWTRFFLLLSGEK